MGQFATLDLRAGVVHGGVEVEVYVKNLNDSGGINTINSLEIDGVSAPWPPPCCSRAPSACR